MSAIVLSVGSIALSLYAILAVRRLQRGLDRIETLQRQTAARLDEREKKWRASLE